MDEREDTEVRQEDDQRKSIVQQMLQRSTKFLRWIIAPVGGQGGVTLPSFPDLKITFGR